MAVERACFRADFQGGREIYHYLPIEERHYSRPEEMPSIRLYMRSVEFSGILLRVKQKTNHDKNKFAISYCRDYQSLSSVFCADYRHRV